MKTNEVEKKTGLKKQTILYYEKEGLISPKRDNNDYRLYNEKDIQTLMIIKLLRSMNISIDDIKLVLTNQLSFQKCLETQSQLLQQTLDNIHEIKQNIDFYKKKNIPIISTLLQVNQIDENSLFGYNRSTPNISINRRLTPQFLRKKLLAKILISVSLGVASYIGYIKVMKESNIYIFIGTTLFMLLLQILAFGIGYGEMNAFSTTQNSTIFIEFDETGVNYHKKESLLEQLKYALNILRGIDKIEHANYEDITKVVMTHVKRYMKIPGTNIPTHIDTVDFQFYFYNGDTLFIMNPIILDQDREIINDILQEKVNQLIIK